MRYIVLIIDILFLLVGPLSLFLKIDGDISVNSEIATTAIITVILTFMLFMAEIISMLTISESTHHTILISGGLLLYALFSPDMEIFYRMCNLKIPLLIYEIMCGVAYLGIVLSFFHFLIFTYHPQKKKESYITIFCISLIGAISYIVFTFFNLQIIAQSLLVIAISIYFIRFATLCARMGIENINLFISQIVLFVSSGMHTVNVMYFSGMFAMVGWYSSSYIWISILCFVSIYVIFIIREARIAQQANKIYKRAAKLESRVLFGQIKPHFIFNALTTVKSMYHKNLDEGDETLNLLSAYLRNSISMLDGDLVTFQKELSFIEQYVDFYNLGIKNKICMLYDIDFSDFLVPAFSLQPFIENAVKYSRVNEKEEGCIIISAHLCKDGVILKIIDNGVGFDISSIRTEARGIKNACERFRLLLGVDPIIESIISKGTIITIHITKDIVKEEE